MMRSRNRPITPTTKTTTIRLAKLSALPLLNWSMTYLPMPSLEASSSAATSTIQPTPRLIRMPANISGRALGSTILNRRFQKPSLSTRATLMWSWSIDATPRAVLASVAHRLHKATTAAEARKAGLIS